jgi:hypothetical protein
MFHLNNIKMKKVLMICGAAVFGMATLVHAQDQDTASTDYNSQPPVEQQDQSTSPTLDQPTEDPSLNQPTQDPTLDQPTQDPTLDQPTQEPPVQDPALDRPTQDPAPTQEPAPTEDPALDQPTQDQPVDDGTNAIPQGQSRESQEATEDQTDQSTDPASTVDPSSSTDPSMERPNEMTPVEGKSGPNGEAVFMENGKYYYMDEAGEKKKIKKSQLQDKIQ